jgi:acyl-CoA synthetase (AMP-forming)/AMP-acid ligase II
VFTSGTTGLPKLVPFPHQRLIGSGVVFGSILLDLKPGEIHYCALPLFHSNPLTQGLGPALYNGATLAIGRKFSTRNFWNQIRKFNAVSFN